MSRPLSLRMVLVMAVAPLMWAGNAVVGRLVHTLISPLTINLIRWMLAALVLGALAGWVLRRDSGLWTHHASPALRADRERKPLGCG